MSRLLIFFMIQPWLHESGQTTRNLQSLPLADLAAIDQHPFAVIVFRVGGIAVGGALDLGPGAETFNGWPAFLAFLAVGGGEGDVDRGHGAR